MCGGTVSATVSLPIPQSARSFLQINMYYVWAMAWPLRLLIVWEGRACLCIYIRNNIRTGYPRSQQLPLVIISDTISVGLLAAPLENMTTCPGHPFRTHHPLNMTNHNGVLGLASNWVYGGVHAVYRHNGMWIPYLAGSHNLREGTREGGWTRYVPQGEAGWRTRQSETSHWSHKPHHDNITLLSHSLMVNHHWD